MMTGLLILWAGCTLVVIVLLVYRGTLSMHEDDQLFLDSAEDHMQKEQAELIGAMERITPWLRVCGILSVLLLLAIAGLKIYSIATK
jgi:hypothetical protein